jgi:hypothetical protein
VVPGVVSGCGYGAFVAIRDPFVVIDALADPQTLYVFGVIAARTSKIGMSTSEGTRSTPFVTPFVTPFGLMRETLLSREEVDAVAERLKRAGLLEVFVDDECGYESWRISEAALVAASTGSEGVLSRSSHA